MFAVVALLLSMLGLYGVLAHLVARRTREIGIRMALGSTVRGIFYLVLSEGAMLIGVGLVLGLGGAIAMAQALKGLVFGVQPTDPVLLGTVALRQGVSRFWRASRLRAGRRGSIRWTCSPSRDRLLTNTA